MHLATQPRTHIVCQDEEQIIMVLKYAAFFCFIYHFTVFFIKLGRG